MPTDKLKFNQVDDRSIKEIKLSTIWKHVLNDNSKVVETFPVKIAEIVSIHYRIEMFFVLECHSNASISVKKKKQALLTTKLILDYKILNSNMSSLFAKLPFLIGKISI